LIYVSIVCEAQYIFVYVKVSKEPKKGNRGLREWVKVSLFFLQLMSFTCMFYGFIQTGMTFYIVFIIIKNLVWEEAVLYFAIIG